jgi:hypothetical protein
VKNGGLAEAVLPEYYVVRKHSGENAAARAARIDPIEAPRQQ